MRMREGGLLGQEVRSSSSGGWRGVGPDGGTFKSGCSAAGSPAHPRGEAGDKTLAPAHRCPRRPGLGRSFSRGQLPGGSLLEE